MLQHARRREIVLPETKPETEWLRGRAVRKVSPRLDHARLQMWWANRLSAWGGDHGESGTEWRFRLQPQDDPEADVRPLVPDVSYLSRARMGDADDEEWQLPLIAPDVAVEIRSPGDSYADLYDKALMLLRAGTAVVIVVNPRTRTVIPWDSARKRIFSPGDTFEHPAMPAFTFAVDDLFSVLPARRSQIGRPRSH